jgi:hypothetical protein
MMLKMTQASKQNTRDESQIHLSDPIPNTVTYAPIDNSCNKQKQLKMGSVLVYCNYSIVYTYMSSKKKIWSNL